MAVRTAFRSDEEALLARLQEAATSVEGYYAQYVDEIEVRDKLILEAVQHGTPILQIAPRARLSGPRINQIIARRWPR